MAYRRLSPPDNSLHNALTPQVGAFCIVLPCSVAVMTWKPYRTKYEPIADIWQITQILRMDFKGI